MSSKTGVPALCLYGAGGHCKVVAATFSRGGRYRVIGLLDDAPALWGTAVYGLQVLGGADQFARLHAEGVRFAHVSIGDNRVRKARAKVLLEQGFSLASAIDPSAVVLSDLSRSVGLAILPFVFVGAEVEMGDNIIASIHTMIGHDCRVSDYAHLAPGVNLGGGVRLGEGTFLGLNASVLPGVRIGAWVTVGAGAVVASDLPDGVTAVGVPARIVGRSEAMNARQQRAGAEE